MKAKRECGEGSARGVDRKMDQRCMKVELWSGRIAKEMSMVIMLGVNTSRRGAGLLTGSAVLMGLEKEVRSAVSSSSAIRVEVIEWAPVGS